MAVAEKAVGEGEGGLGDQEAAVASGAEEAAALAAGEAGEQGHPGLLDQPLWRQRRCCPCQSTEAAGDRRVGEDRPWRPAELHRVARVGGAGEQFPPHTYPKIRVLVKVYQERGDMDGYGWIDILLLKVHVGLLHGIHLLTDELHLVDLRLDYSNMLARAATRGCASRQAGAAGIAFGKKGICAQVDAEGSG